jgi:integrase
MTKLTVLEVRNAAPRARPYRLSDGDGLVLQVMPNGARYWRRRYWIAGKEKMLALGIFPDVSLSDARAAAADAGRMVAAGLDPALQKRASREVQADADDDRLETVAREWLEVKKPEWSDSYHERVSTALVRDIYPHLGQRALSSIEPRDLLPVLLSVQRRGAKETGHRLRRWLSPVFRYGIVKGMCERDPCADLKGALMSMSHGRMPTITDPERIGHLLRAIDTYWGTQVVKTALALAPLVFQRPGDLRHAKWAEFDLAKALWTIPAERMKIRKVKKPLTDDHVVPLSRQAVALLTSLYPVTGHGRAGYVFPGARSSLRPMSENAVNVALHNIGFKGEIVGHGFRHMASTLLNESGWRDDAVESQLAHRDKNVIRGTYNLAKYMQERRKMMQAWADYLDTLRTATPARQESAEAG